MSKSIKCQSCKEQAAVWAWQPFGPDETPDCYTTLGSHYRGFPVIKVCSFCKGAFQSGDFPVPFVYKGFSYIGENHQVREIHVSLWKGDTISPTDLNPSKAIMLMKDTPNGGPDVVALVFEEYADLLHALQIAPELLEACQDLDTFYSQIDRYLSYMHVPQEDHTTIMLALAKIRTIMKSAE